MNTTTITTKHLFKLDFLNLISCIAVVWLHVNTIVWTFSYEPYWISSWFIETVLYWPVPMFFMIMGITLLNYRERYDTKTFLKKRFCKTGIPFIFWSIISIFASIYWWKYLPADTSLSLISFIDIIINCKGLSIYWFFPALFSVYLSIPVLSIIQKDKLISTYSYIVWYGLFSIVLLPFISYFLHITFNDALKSPICGGYILYVLLGFLLWNTDFSKKKRYCIYIIGFCAWLTRFLGGWYLSYQNGTVDGTFNGYLNLPCVAQSIAVFVFIKYLDLSTLEKKYSSLIKKLSSYSFGVYLIHFYILKFFVDYFNIPLTSLTWRLFGSFFVYITSLFTIHLLKKFLI